MLCLAAVILNPFGEDAHDFPCALYLHKLWKSRYMSAVLLQDIVQIDAELSRRLPLGIEKPKTVGPAVVRRSQLPDEDVHGDEEGCDDEDDGE